MHMSIDDKSDYFSWDLNKIGAVVCDAAIYSITHVVAAQIFSQDKSGWAAVGKVILPFAVTQLNVGASLFGKETEQPVIAQAVKTETAVSGGSVDNPVPQQKKNSEFFPLDLMGEVQEPHRRQ